MHFLAAIPPVIENHPHWFVAGLIVVVGLLGFGLRDVLRFSFSRVWAISGVCFDESIRRRVLWITPLAILGVIIVSQLQHPADHQDAIFQTTKFCIFATGTLLVITTIILACTNLPKEIDTRVIYTIVTKPTTRLEIVLGKILGFARVSAAILLIMGVFSLGYLKVRSMTLERDIRQRLSANLVDPASKPTWEHYARTGLLTSRDVAHPYSLNFYSRMPDPKSDTRWVVGGDIGQHVLVPFDIDEQDLVPPDAPSAPPGSTGLVVLVKMKFERRSDATTRPAASRPFIPTPLLASTQPWTGDPNTRGDPTVVVDITDAYNEPLVMSNLINEGQQILLDNSHTTIPFSIRPEGLEKLFETPFEGKKKRIHVRVTPTGHGIDYAMPTLPAMLIVPPTTPGGQEKRIGPAIDQSDRPLLASFRGRSTSGNAQQLKGSSSPKGQVAVYHFNNVRVTPDANGQVSLETKLAIERGDDEDMTDDAATEVTVQVLNHKTGQLSPPILLKPENRRVAYLSVPASTMDGGTFDVVFRCVREAHWITLTDRSLGLVLGYDSFALNLLKSMTILWLMSLLVITISIFCSTFVSWPIAIVLTLVILLGRWGVTQLQDSLTTGIGHEVVNTWFPGSSPPAAKAISSSVEGLTRALNALAKILPDVERFPATQDIDAGFSIPWSQLKESLFVIGSFALPLAVLAFVLLKYKEVAP